MKYLMIHLTYLMGAVLACLGHLHSARSTRNLTEHVSRRWTVYISPVHTWKADDDGSGFYTIPYCYYDANSWTQLDGIVRAALKLWYDQLGAPGKASNHGLRVMEPDPFGTPLEDFPYCYTDDNVGKRWNVHFKPETLVIKYTDDPNEMQPGGGRGHPGYDPIGGAGRHDLVMNPGNEIIETVVAMAAHEFGHVFGLTHEHQRTDRDSYVNFEPKNLIGYDDAENALKAQTQYTMDEIVNDDFLAEQFEFPGATQFSKTMKVPGEQTVIGVYRGPFDVDSIMMYSSTQGMRSGNEDDVKDLVLVKWNNPPQDPPPVERTPDNCQAIPRPSKVSDLDRDGLKAIYPWLGN